VGEHDSAAGIAGGERAGVEAQDGGDIGITGSVEVVHALMRADLVDEYRLFVYPRSSFGGRNLVREGMLEPLNLVESRSFPSGVVLLDYTRP
jgi:dihydrofolate reductase